MASPKSPGLKPTELGLGGKYSNISLYKTALINGINSKKKEFDAVHPEYTNYLIFLVNNAGSGRAFAGFNELKQILLKTPTVSDSKNSFSEIEKYFAEAVGPIAIVESNEYKGKTPFTNNSSVGVPTSKNESGYDFTINGTEITVKMPTGKTNTLKPGDIINDKEFSKLVAKSTNRKLKVLYKLFETLNDATTKRGAYTAIYGTTGSNGILSELIGDKKEQDTILKPGGNVAVPDNIIMMYGNALEKQIENWSKSNGWNVALIEFTNLYYTTKKLFAFSLKVGAGGKATPKFKNAVKGASITGKGRAGPFGTDANGNMTSSSTRVKPEKLGIQMTF
jgi:hypothetical protein|tara:strand:+ start:515 stop:1522 length:1008 start_codon:yes stop_codon:yes gene_type:complete